MRVMTVLVLFLGLAVTASAQKKAKSSEIAISIGASNLLSDLGGSQYEGKTFLADLEFTATRPSMGVFFRQTFNKKLAARVNLYYAQVFGDDALTNVTMDNPSAPGWARKYRNLSFKSHILEASFVVEYNLFRYTPGSTFERFTPYILAGFGGFHFDPKANFDGEWVRLQPLGTEGQGLPQYPAKEKYSNFALCFPFGMGFKYNVSKNYSFGFEIAHRMTTTDYIDDVSTTYADPEHFIEYYGPEKGAMIAALADRTNGELSGATAPGEQRGDPSDHDTYTFAGMFTLTYVFNQQRSGNGLLYCPIRW